MLFAGASKAESACACYPVPVPYVFGSLRGEGDVSAGDLVCGRALSQALESNPKMLTPILLEATGGAFLAHHQLDRA